MSNYIKIANELNNQLADLEIRLNANIVSCARVVYEFTDEKPYRRDTSEMNFESRSFKSFLDNYRIIEAIEINSWSISFHSDSEQLSFRFNELHRYKVTDKLAILDILEQLLKS